MLMEFEYLNHLDSDLHQFLVEQHHQHHLHHQHYMLEYSMNHYLDVPNQMKVLHLLCLGKEPWWQRGLVSECDLWQGCFASTSKCLTLLIYYIL